MTRVKRSVHARKKRRATSIASCGLSPTTSGTSRGSPPHPAATSNQVKQQAPTDNLSADTRRRDLNRGPAGARPVAELAFASHSVVVGVDLGA
jgi:hypothetical protein